MKKALKYLNKAAEYGDSLAMLKLGWYYQKISKSLQAYKWLSIARKNGEIVPQIFLINLKNKLTGEQTKKIDAEIKLWVPIEAKQTGENGFLPTWNWKKAVGL